MATVMLKQPVAAPPRISLPESIVFCHPGYDSPFDELLRLPRLDSTSTSLPVSSSASPPPAMGVHHGTALLACQIVANNAFDGYLATDRDGKNRVTAGPDELLYREMYWFIATANGTDGENGDADSRKYPVVPSFQDWPFPRDRFAGLRWRPYAESPPDQTPATDAASPTVPSMPPPPRPSMRRCAVANTSYAVNASHLVPVAHKNWFIRNGMVTYARGDASAGIDSMSNVLHMQHTLHSVWDRHVFALVPKQSEFVVHILATPDDTICEFAVQWHNTPVQKTALEGKSDEYLFAKFAQAVFMLTKPFVIYSGAIPRRIARFQEVRNAEGAVTGYKIVTEEVAGNELNEQYGGGGSRSASASRKRSRSGATGDAEEATWYERNVRARVDWTMDDEEADWYDRVVRPTLLQEEEVDLWPDEKPRGRPREREPARLQWRSRDHTMDTIPSLTDASLDFDEDHSLHSQESTTSAPGTTRDAEVCKDASTKTDQDGPGSRVSFPGTCALPRQRNAGTLTFAQQIGRIDQPPNKIALRSDLHELFEPRYLTIVPKPVFVQAPSLSSSSFSSADTASATTPPALSQYALAVHVLSSSTYELIPLYHNLALRYQAPGNGPSQQYSGSREFLFARFAWSIFWLLQEFLDTPRWVVVCSSRAQTNSLATNHEYMWASNASLAPKATPSSRSFSKRPASDIAQDAGDNSLQSKRRRMRVRPVEELLNSGEELDEDELFQLDGGQFKLYEAMRLRAEREEEPSGGEELAELDFYQHQCEVERWRSQTFSERGDDDEYIDAGDTALYGGCSRHRDSRAKSPTDPSFSYSDGYDRSSAVLSHLDVANNIDGNALTMDDSAT